MLCSSCYTLSGFRTKYPVSLKQTGLHHLCTAVITFFQKFISLQLLTVIGIWTMFPFKMLFY
jgi:hypothetical protein